VVVAKQLMLGVARTIDVLIQVGGDDYLLAPRSDNVGTLHSFNGCSVQFREWPKADSYNLVVAPDDRVFEYIAHDIEVDKFSCVLADSQITSSDLTQYTPQSAHIIKQVSGSILNIH